MRHWHNGPIRKCGRKFGIVFPTFRHCYFIVQWLDYGYYAGYFDDVFWKKLEDAGRVTKLPWWRFLDIFLCSGRTRRIRRKCCTSTPAEVLNAVIAARILLGPIRNTEQR